MDGGQEGRTERGERRAPRRRLRWFVLACLGLAGVLWTVRAALVGSILRHVARRSGVELAWRDLDLAGLRRIEFRDLVARRAGDLDLQAERVAVEFDALSLLRGDSAGWERLELDGARGTAGPFGIPARTGSGAFRLPARLPHVEARASDLTWRATPGRSFRLRDAELSFDGRSAQLAASAFAWVEGPRTIEHPLTVRADVHASRFDVARAVWDPRFVLEDAQIDLADADTGHVSFEALARGFDGTARLAGRVEEGALRVGGRVDDLDLGAAWQAFGPPDAPPVRGRVSGAANLSLPFSDPRACEAELDFRTRDVSFVRALDELSGHVEIGPHGIRLDDVLVVHGANAVLLSGRAPPLGTAACDWIDGLDAFAALEFGDPRAVLAVDVALPLQADEPWTRGALRGEARWFGGEVNGRCEVRGLDLGALTRAFGSTPGFTGTLDAWADLCVPLHAPAYPTVDGWILAADGGVGEHHLDACTARVRFDPDGVTVLGADACEGENHASLAWARLPRPLIAGCPPAEVPGLFVVGLQAELDDLPRLLRGPLAAPALDRLHAHRLELSGSAAAGEIALTSGRFDTAAGTGRILRGRVPLVTRLDDVLVDERLDLDLQLDFDDVGPAVAALFPDAFAGEEQPHGAVAGSAHVTGGARGPRGVLDLVARDLEVRGVTFERADARAQLDEHALVVEALEARSSLGTLALAGTYGFDDRRVTGGRLDLDVADLSRLAPETLPAGTVTMHARAEGPLASLEGTADVQARSLAWQGVTLDELVLRARAAGGTFQVDCTRLRGFDVEASFSARTTGFDWIARRGDVDLDALALSWSDVRATLAEPTRLRFTPEGLALDSLRLEGSGGRVHASLVRAADESRVQVALAAPLPREVLELLGLRLGTAEIDAGLSVVLRGRALTGRTNGVVTLHGDEPGLAARLEWDAALDAGRLVVEHLELASSEPEPRFAARISGSCPLDPLGAEVLPEGPLQAHVEASVPDLSRAGFLPELWRAQGASRVEAELAGTWTALRGTLSATCQGLSAPGLAPLAQVGSIDGSAQLTLEDVVRLDALDVQVDTGARLRAAGTLGASLDARALLHDRVDVLRSAPLDLAVQAEAQDLAEVLPRFPILRRVGGRAQAEARVTGSLASPRWSGSGTLAGGEIRTTTDLPAIVGVSGRVSFDGRDLQVEALAGEMGGAPFALHGRVGIAGGEVDADLALTGSNLLVWRDRDVTVRADADLRLKGPLDELVLSGDLALRDGRFTRKLDFLTLGRRGPRLAGTRGLRLFELTERPLASLRFDVNVTSATPFTVASNVVRGRVIPTLRLVGTGALPELRGNVLVEPSRVLLPSGALRVRSGRIEFRADRPDVPDLDIQASARLQGYDVEVNVSGSYDDPKVELSSVPPLPREDLAVLLITGRPPASGLAGALGQRAALDIAVYIARDVAAAWFESDEEDVESLAERLEVVVGADRTRSGADAVLVRMRIAGDLQTKNRAVYLTGERDVYDFYNFGLRFVFSFQ